MLQFALSQQLDAPPFAFRATGIRVYSFEEALYHVYHYWRESVEDLLSDDMMTWVSDLGLTYLAARMKGLRRVDSFADRMMGFLRLAEYFDEGELAVMKNELKRWEARREWEQLKDRADYFLTRNDPAKAVPLYRRALQYEENVPLFNNLAVAHMRLGAHDEALRLLARARVLEPGSTALALHYAEAAMLGGEFERAQRALHKAETLIEQNHKAPEYSRTTADVAFLYGLMAFEQSDYTTALKHFETARAQNADVPLYAYKTADTYLRMRQFDHALGALEQVKTPDEEYYTKKAEIYTAYGNIPAAIRTIKQAQEKGDSANLWVRLAAYLRQDYDFERANEAITRALALDPENDNARLENARIKKGLGRTREYQAGLTDVLRGFKKRYRDG